MSSILEKLCDVTRPEQDSPELREVVVKLGKYYAAIQHEFGLSFVDEFCGLFCEATAISEEEGFVRGLRVCYQLFSALASDSRYSS